MRDKPIPFYATTSAVKRGLDAMLENMTHCKNTLPPENYKEVYSFVNTNYAIHLKELTDRGEYDSWKSYRNKWRELQ